MEIDEATRNVPGSPKIEDSILDKINHSDIFICDITPVTAFHQKLMPNSNVVFELGYALHTLGESHVILLAKMKEKDPKDLPFDFCHRRIIIFSSNHDCDLSSDIDDCIKECIRHPVYKQSGLSFPHLFDKFYISYFRSKEEANKPKGSVKATEESTVFFSRRMAAAFPGVRGLKEIINKRKIWQSLSVLLQQPLTFAQGLENATPDPIWWFRGRGALPIERFSKIRISRLLMNYEELRIQRIIVYRDSGRYYQQYVYVETCPDQPSGCYSYRKGEIKDNAGSFGYYNEEFAVFKPKCFLPSRHITRQEYDDGATTIFSRNVELQGRAKLRERYLTPYNFIIAAKFSPYNSEEYCQSSQDYLTAMLEKKISKEEFNDYMLKFPRRDV